MRRLFTVIMAGASSIIVGQTIPCRVRPATVLQCPAVGCAIPGTPEAIANQVRNTLPLPKPIVTLTIDDFERLQSALRAHQGLVAPDRSRFHARIPNHGTLSEGDMVAVLGFIVGTPRSHRADPANCLLIGRDSNVFRFNIADLKDDTQYDSVMAEIVPRLFDAQGMPHVRNPAWTLEKLRRIKSEGHKVRVTGKLFFDNKHLVNSDPDDAIGGEPARLSLWEITPVTAVQVCKLKKANCGLADQDWIALENFR